MGVKSDSWIMKMSEEFDMIKPFSKEPSENGKISYGVSSYGYDIRLADEFRIYKGNSHEIIDPKHLNEDSFKKFKRDICLIPPHSYILGRSFEYLKIPRNIMAICFGKSTYARCGIIINVTPLEPEWHGFITISISNPNSYPVRLYPNEGIAQVIFLEAKEICMKSYMDKNGKYQAQQDITLPKV